MKRAIILLTAAALAAACSSSTEGTGSSNGGSDQPLSAQVASYEVVAGQAERFLVGLFTKDGVVSYGAADLSFSYLGDGQASPQAGPTTSATFLLVPQETGHTHDGSDASHSESPMASPSEAGASDMGGMSPEPGAQGTTPATYGVLEAAETEAPQITQPDQVRGVYVAKDVMLDKAGIWQVEVSVELDGTTDTATAAFDVVDKPVYPFPGQDAPPSRNLVMHSEDAKPSMVDSRATDGWNSVPDPELHATTIADSLAAGRPVVVAVTTPLYCQSRFCGPVTEEVEALAAEYSDVADFVHLEVWRDYQNKVVNKAAAEWVYRDDITEPWVFLVGSDGRVMQRWQNVLDPRELQEALQGLSSGASPSAMASSMP